MQDQVCNHSPLGMLGYHQPRDVPVHGLRRVGEGRATSERSLADSHGQIGILLTLFAVRSRRHSYHSQADRAGSIPVTRSKREKRCSTSESDCISQAGQCSFASENGTRAITRAINHLGEWPRTSQPVQPAASAPLRRPCGQLVVNRGTNPRHAQVRAVRGALLKIAVGSYPPWVRIPRTPPNRMEAR
jgi:hypothetical protein